MKLDPFYLIVDSARWIERLVPLGVRLVQLRMKNADPMYCRNEIRRARRMCMENDCQLIINDFWQLAIEESCDFIHLGQEDMANADLPAIRAAGIRIGLSTHDDRELDAALAAKPDYIALGPVWPTALKVMPWAPQTPDRLPVWKARIGALPLVAIGGLTPDRARIVLEHGADSAAVVTDIARHENPEARTRAWLEATALWR